MNIKYNQKYQTLEKLKENTENFLKQSNTLKGHKHVVFSAIKENVKILQISSEELKNDEVLVLSAIKENIKILQNSSEKLRNDKEFVLEVVEQNFDILNSANKELTANKKFLHEFVKQNNLAIYNNTQQNLDENIAFQAVTITDEHIDQEYARQFLMIDKTLSDPLLYVKQNDNSLQFSEKNTQFLFARENLTKNKKDTDNSIRVKKNKL